MKEKVLRSVALIVFAMFAVAPCFAHHMAVVVSKQNKTETVSSVQLSKIFRAETRKWPDGTDIRLVLHRSSMGEAVTLGRLNKMSTQQWQKWVSGHRDSIELVDSDKDVLKYVESTPAAIGLVDVRSLTGGVNVVRVDGKVPMEDGYLPH